MGARLPAGPTAGKNESVTQLQWKGRERTVGQGGEIGSQGPGRREKMTVIPDRTASQLGSEEGRRPEREYGGEDQSITKPSHPGKKRRSLLDGERSVRRGFQGVG